MLRAGLLLLMASVGMADSEVGKTIRKTVSAEAVNDALRRVVDDAKKAAGS